MAGICNENIFSAFFKSQAKSLRNYLYFKYGNEEMANDMAQDAFIKLWEKCADIPEEKAKSFLYTVANNASLNQIAHQKVVLKHAKNVGANESTDVDPAYIMEEEQFKVKLEKAIESLTEAQRTAFLLHRIEGKKYAEIAEMLEISVKAVEKRIHGALLSLRNEIDGFK
ncbi:sigma-70 family RNA polymerase sigma factor [Flavobacterium sp. CYK-55]|uniref:RNA polymerase sigma factor n=1 Tax=Flavobacterium sp. CYK-55 TaxID=2835529 RepID=UPI001BCE5D52|nr:sigma-70 family RNA polymerase sigma factor [Flavobacterium sp. CYK-55]MBS7786348.1 sigma-70 family RNA polymerase sigma factor [Flavobacterium sp. CYK-55]